MRDLKSSDKNSIAIFDKLSGSMVGFYYRTPTTKERVKYNSDQVRALNSSNYDGLFENQIDWAKKLITGIFGNSFSYNEKEISSDPASENYDANWMKHIEETSSDLLTIFIESVMGKTSFVVKIGGVTEDFFTKSSGNTTEPGLQKKENTI